MYTHLYCIVLLDYNLSKKKVKVIINDCLQVMFYIHVYLYRKSDHYYLLGKGGYVFGSVGLFVCLSVCLWTTLLKKL